MRHVTVPLQLKGLILLGDEVLAHEPSQSLWFPYCSVLLMHFQSFKFSYLAEGFFSGWREIPLGFLQGTIRLVYSKKSRFQRSCTLSWSPRPQITNLQGHIKVIDSPLKLATLGIS